MIGHFLNAEARNDQKRHLSLYFRTYESIITY